MKGKKRISALAISAVVFPTVFLTGTSAGDAACRAGYEERLKASGEVYCVGTKSVKEQRRQRDVRAQQITVETANKIERSRRYFGYYDRQRLDRTFGSGPATQFKPLEKPRR